MKNKTIIFTLLALMSTTFFSLDAQTIVSTQVENRNVIIEEFTGRDCLYCPNGHALAAQMKNAYPDDLFVLARHAGSFSPTDYPNLNLPESDSIRAHFGVSSYPSGAINRITYQGSGPGLSLNDWSGAANQILNETSYVNVGVEASIDPSNRLLTVHTELYYTANAGTFNQISVVLAQSEIIGYQIGVGPYYEFNHNPIYQFTGVWGEEIENTTSGSFVDQTYSLTLPEYFNDIEIDLNNLDVVVYVSDGNQTIISGSGCEASMEPAFNDDPAITNCFLPGNQCKDVLEPAIEITNTGNDVLTSVEIEYMVNSGEVEEYTWTGSLNFLEKTVVVLPEISFEIKQNNIFEATIINDENPINNNIQKPFDFAINIDGEFKIEYKTIFESDENYWEILNESGEVVLSGEGYGNLSTYEIDVEIEVDGCYDFVFYDTEGNGFSSPSAYLKIIKDDEVLFAITGDFGSEINWPFASNYELSTFDTPAENSEITFFPNPCSKVLHLISDTEIENVEIFDHMGRLMKQESSAADFSFINVENYPKGIYIFKMRTKNGTSIKKIIVD